jgi:carbon-monoxide dehydrogenase medium subunit
MIPGEFAYHRPASLNEAIGLLSSLGDDVKLLSGGQSLVPLMKLRLSKPLHVIDLGGISALDFIRQDGDKIIIGALATHSRVEDSELLKRKCPLLPQTATTIADVQVRNRGTVGGSLAHADPTGDLPPAVLAVNAEIKVAGPRGERWIKAGDFFVTMLTTAMEPDEILTEVRVPVQEQHKTSYLKAAQRASGFAVVGVAVSLNLNQDQTCQDIGIGVTGVTDKAYRATNVEDMLRGQKLATDLIERAAVRVVDGIDVNADINATPEYRSHLARVYTARAIASALRS